MSILEFIFYLTGSILLLGKLGSIIASLGLVIYGCHRLNKFLKRIQKESCTTCQ